jgi:hypothetical protein
MFYIFLWLHSIAAAVPESDAATVEDETVLEDPADFEEPAETPPQERALQEPSIQTVDVVIELVNGIRMSGTAPLREVIYWEPGKAIRFTPRGGEEILLDGDRIQNSQVDEFLETDVAAVEQVSLADPVSGLVDLPDYSSPRGFRYPNPAASRYLYAPSAIALKKGQGYVSQKAAITAAAYALNDHFTALVGTFTFFPPLLTVIGGKVALPVSDKLYIGAGGETFLIPIDSELAAAIAFANLTYGDADKHITIASGFLGGDYLDNFLDTSGAIPVMIGGHIRKSDRAAFVTENWIILDDFKEPLVALAATAAVRLVGKRDVAERRRATRVSSEGFSRVTWDFGLIFSVYRQSSQYYNRGELESEYIGYRNLGPIPWIDYTWHFGPMG